MILSIIAIVNNSELSYQHKEHNSNKIIICEELENVFTQGVYLPATRELYSKFKTMVCMHAVRLHILTCQLIMMYTVKDIPASATHPSTKMNFMAS